MKNKIRWRYILDVTVQEQIRTALKIDFLKEQFDAFSEKAKTDFDQVKTQLQPNLVKTEMIQFFNDMTEKMETFAEDIQEWDGSNQEVITSYL